MTSNEIFGHCSECDNSTWRQSAAGTFVCVNCAKRLASLAGKPFIPNPGDFMKEQQFNDAKTIAWWDGRWKQDAVMALICGAVFVAGMLTGYFAKEPVAKPVHARVIQA
jgi:hypothetical protein